MVGISERVYVFLLCINSADHQREVNSLSSCIAQINRFVGGSQLVEDELGEFALGLAHIDSRSVDESSWLVLNDFSDRWVGVSNAHLSPVGLEIKVSVTLMVPQILHVPFCDQQRVLVVKIIDACKVLFALFDDLLVVACERARSMGESRQR